MFVSRTFAKIEEDGQPSRSHDLAEFRATAAYVLLGDPGAGKTTSFEQESKEVGGRFIKARDFLTFEQCEGWRDAVFFIDALDETRAGEGDGRTPLDRIRAKLDQLGRPRFRLSCREADWLGVSDSDALQQVAPSGEIVTLQLEPLNEAQILPILRSRPDISDAETFLTTARERGLANLLDNPQSLLLLVDAFRGHHWPDSKAETYGLACNQLAIEHNYEHRAASRGKQPPLDKLLDAAGYLCALALIADVPGIALNGADPDYLSPEHLIPPDPLPFAEALSTRLFRGEGGTERFVPVHRSVAEYLAARYIARRIDSGLPVSRVLALMTGSDGGVVSGLRGIHAWLAVHCPPSRGVLIDADPLGVVLYGDVKGFSSADKRQLLGGLHDLAKHYPGFRGQDWGARSFGALSTPDMEPAFREILTSPSRDDAQQALVDCVLDALEQGPPQPALADVLLAVVRQEDRWLAVRRGALRGYQKIIQFGPSGLLETLEDIRVGLVGDQDDELLGTLLENLYPARISTRRLLEFLHAPKAPDLIGSYHLFWRQELFEKVPPEDLVILMDGLVERGLPVDPQREYMFAEMEMAGKLLCEALRIHGEVIDIGQLYSWLGLGLDEHEHPRLDQQHHKYIALWITHHPQHYKAVLDYGVRKLLDEDKARFLFYRLKQRLYGAKPPDDLGQWFLSQAENEADPDLARTMLCEAVACMFQEQGDKGMSLEGLESWILRNPAHQEQLQLLLYWEIPDWRRGQAERQEQSESKRKASRSALRDWYLKNIADLRTGAGHPENLHRLAMACCKRYYDIRGETSLERLTDFLGGDSDLAQVALAGLCQTPFRPDLPSVAEIVDSKASDRFHFIRLPCLVAADEQFQKASEKLLAWPDELLERLLAFRYAEGTGDEPEWVKLLVEARPELVAEVLVVYASHLFAARKEHVHGIYPLQHNEAYGQVGRCAVPALLAAFPLRARKYQYTDLVILLKAGLKHLAKDEFAALIHRKLRMKSLGNSQRVYWLTAGLVLDPSRYEQQLAAFVEGNPARARLVAGFFHEGTGRRSAGWELPATSLGLLIRVLGPDGSPRTWSGGASWVSPAMETSELVEGLINRLGTDPTEEASSQIQGFLENSRLKQWHSALRRASQSQQISRREALYRHPSLKEVEQTLANRRPSNAADLAALTGETLREFALWVRDGNADGYKQFWNLDHHGKAVEPRIEDACRDTLLDKLRERLGRLGVDAQPEGHYADDKRADIRVSFGGQGCNVPIEIKRNRHPDLWSAIREQLIARYTRDPGTLGRGIYLVFWFGGDGMPASSDGGGRPRSAAELEARLRKTLTVEEQRVIQVCVLDVAKPER